VSQDLPRLALYGPAVVAYSSDMIRSKGRFPIVARFWSFRGSINAAVLGYVWLALMP